MDILALCFTDRCSALRSLSLARLPLIHISIAASTGALAPLSPPNSGGRPEFEVPQNWGI